MTRRIYSFSITVNFEVPDDQEFCEAEDSDVCQGDCGGECDQYFVKRLKNWLNTCTHDPSTEYISADITREDHNDDECIWIQDQYDTTVCSTCRREKTEDVVFSEVSYSQIEITAEEKHDKRCQVQK